MENVHGGDIYRNEILYDFSVNTNPYGMPETVRRALTDAVAACESYPDITCEALKKAIAAYDEMPERWGLCGNGASELLNAVIHAVRPKKILLPMPSFYGYERAARVEETEIVPYFLKEADDFSVTEALLAALTEDIDMLMLANPNNPTGAVISPALLERIVAACKVNKITIVIDECFFPFTGQEEWLTAQYLQENPQVVSVRAFTKTFAIPGVRLGYLLTSDEKLRDNIERNLSEWNLSSFAQAAGIAAAKEKNYVKISREKIAAQREWMRAELEEMGIRVFPSEANFLLLKTKLPLYEALLKRNILVRDCGNYPGLEKGFYRIAIKKEAENQILSDAIRELVSLEGRG